MLLIDSYISRDEKISDFKWNEDGLFLASMLTEIIVFLLGIGVLIVHYFYWVPKYKINRGLDIVFRSEEWKNSNCNKYFKKTFENKLRIIQFPKE